jgi:hypothetical protein
MKRYGVTVTPSTATAASAKKGSVKSGTSGGVPTRQTSSNNPANTITSHLGSPVVQTGSSATTLSTYMLPNNNRPTNSGFANGSNEVLGRAITAATNTNNTTTTTEVIVRIP